MKKWEKIDSNLIVNSKYFKVRKDDVVLPNGDRKEWIYWDSPDSAMLIGMTKEKKMVMIKQYRYLANQTVIEFAAGSLEKEETARKAAIREFEEECGYRCKNLIKLGSFYETYGQLNRQIHMFFSNDLTKTKQSLNPEDDIIEDIDVLLIDYDEALDMALNNKFVAMGSTLAILLLNEKIRRGEIVLK